MKRQTEGGAFDKYTESICDDPARWIVCTFLKASGLNVWTNPPNPGDQGEYDHPDIYTISDDGEMFGYEVEIRIGQWHNYRLPKWWNRTVHCLQRKSKYFKNDKYAVCNYVQLNSDLTRAIIIPTPLYKAGIWGVIGTGRGEEEIRRVDLREFTEREDYGFIDLRDYTEHYPRRKTWERNRAEYWERNRKMYHPQNEDDTI